MQQRHRQRHYGMDWLRIGAFQLLILYHVGMTFVPWDYQVKMTAPIDWAVVPMFLTNPWRLSLLFAVSGYASAALFVKQPGIAAFLRSRAARLGIPLLFGMAAVVTPQPWVWAITHAGYAHGFGWFLFHDYYRPHFIGPVAMPTWMHLWFVVYLLVYTVIAGGVLALPARVRAALQRGAERLLAGPALLPLGIGWVLFARTCLSPGWEDTHTLVDDFSAHASYLPCFAFGWLIARSPALRGAIAAQWRVAGALAIAGWLFIAGVELAWPGDAVPPIAVRWIYRIARATEGWGAIVGLIGLAEAHWNRDHPWRATLAEAVFPFYLVHQTIIILVGYWLLGTATGPLARFVILVAATAGGCWLFYLGGRQIGWLRPLIGLKRVARTPASASARGHELDADDPRRGRSHRAAADLT